MAGTVVFDMGLTYDQIRGTSVESSRGISVKRVFLSCSMKNAPEITAPADMGQ